jgi:hypothetical protein
MRCFSTSLVAYSRAGRNWAEELQAADRTYGSYQLSGSSSGFMGNRARGFLVAIFPKEIVNTRGDMSRKGSEARGR